MADSAYAQALRFLGPRFLSAHELRQKLRRKEYASEEIEETIERLREMDYINDARLAEQVLRIWMQKAHYGRKYIAQKMWNRGLEPPSGLNDYDEYSVGISMAERLLLKSKKHDNNQDQLDNERIDLHQRDKVIRFLKNRGFESNTIHRICADLFA